METGSEATTDLARLLDLQPDPARPGHYQVDVSPGWNCPIVPQGGVMAALAARAMEVEIRRTTAEASDGNGSDGPRLRSLTTVFAAQVPAGPVEVEVTVLRTGRSLAQARADVRTPGGPVGHTTVAVFGRDRPGFEFTDVAMPDVPRPPDCPSFRDELPEGVERPGERPEFPFWDHMEGRPALGHAPWDEWVPDRSDVATWFRLDDPPRRPNGTLDPMMAVLMCDTMPSAVGERMGPGTPFWLPPSADLTVHLLAEPRSEWLLAHNTARRAGGGYASTAVHLWDPEVGLVAYGTQVMVLVFPGDPPTGDQRIPVDLRPLRSDAEPVAPPGA